jgi:hypothetical protein
MREKEAADKDERERGKKKKKRDAQSAIDIRGQGKSTVDRPARCRVRF